MICTACVVRDSKGIAKAGDDACSKDVSYCYLQCAVAEDKIDAA
jgi:hypothetical protein